ncbi:MAG: tetratricopeptide repeat protein [Candidatus Geothermincolia bacterium]
MTYPDLAWRIAATMSDGARKRTALLLAVSLAALAILPFAQAVRHPFLAYDDDRFVTENPAVRSGLTPAGVIWAFTSSYAANWQPLAWISHMTDVELYGLDPAGHHGTNLALHGLNAALLFLLLLRLTGAAGRSFAAAALFAVHPLRVEAVMWVAQRNNLLGASFGLLSLLAYARYAARPTAVRYAAALVWFVFGLLSKPIVLTLPFVFFLLDYWPLDRNRPPSTPPPRRRRPLLEKLPFVALSCGSAIVTYLAQSRGHAVAGLATVPLEWRVSNAAVAYVRYLFHIVWPVDLVVLYPYPAGRFSLPLTLLALLLLVAVGAGAVRVRNRWPAVLVGWLWFLGMFVPMIGIVQAGSQSMADRYTYWPAIGLAVAAVWLAGDTAAALGVRGGLRAAFAGTLLLSFGLQSARLATTWSSDLALFGRATALTAGNFIAEVNVGAALARAGRTEEALVRYRRAISFNPRYADAHFNLALNLDRLGRTAEARASYLEALRCDPRHAAAQNNLGQFSARQGRDEEALAYFREALHNNPNLTQAHVNLGLVLVRLGRREEAAGHLRAVLRLQPGNSAVRAELQRLAESRD